MCGRYSFIYALSRIQALFEVDKPFSGVWRPSYNIAPTQNAPIIFSDENSKNKNELSISPWGFIPHWAKKDAKPIPIINARAETVHSSPAFRYAFEHSRCLVPFTHFFEWKKEKTKVPFAIHLKKNDIGAFAGIYSEWEGKKHFAIITTSPNPLMKSIHDRMPVILSKPNQKKWLKPEMSVEKRAGLLTSFDETKMEMFPVSTLVNSPRNNSPDVLVPARGHQERLS